MEDELHKIYDIINDLWRFMKQYYPAKDTDEYWTEATQAANDIWNKHNRDILCQKLLNTCLKYLQDGQDGLK